MAQVVVAEVHLDLPFMAVAAAAAVMAAAAEIRNQFLGFLRIPHQVDQRLETQSQLQLIRAPEGAVVRATTILQVHPVRAVTVVLRSHCSAQLNSAARYWLTVPMAVLASVQALGHLLVVAVPEAVSYWTET